MLSKRFKIKLFSEWVKELEGDLGKYDRSKNSAAANEAHKKIISEIDSFPKANKEIITAKQIVGFCTRLVAITDELRKKKKDDDKNLIEILELAEVNLANNPDTFRFIEFQRAIDKVQAIIECLSAANDVTKQDSPSSINLQILQSVFKACNNYTKMEDNDVLITLLKKLIVAKESSQVDDRVRKVIDNVYVEARSEFRSKFLCAVRLDYFEVGACLMKGTSWVSPANLVKIYNDAAAKLRSGFKSGLRPMKDLLLCVTEEVRLNLKDTDQISIDNYKKIKESIACFGREAEALYCLHDGSDPMYPHKLSTVIRALCVVIEQTKILGDIRDRIRGFIAANNANKDQVRIALLKQVLDIDAKSHDPLAGVTRILTSLLENKQQAASSSDDQDEICEFAYSMLKLTKMERSSEFNSNSSSFFHLVDGATTCSQLIASYPKDQERIQRGLGN